MKFLFQFLSLFISFSALAQTPLIEWEKSFGGTDFDIPTSSFRTSDNGYIITGTSNSDDGDLTVNYGSNDYWVIKISSEGNLEWQKSLGGSNGETSYDVIQTKDSGYIISGFSRSNDNDVSSNNGGEDIWIVKLDSTGNIEWEKSYGGTLNENGESIVNTKDGGFIIAGNSTSNNGDVSNNYGDVDVWVLKISNIGLIEWEKNYGGTGLDTGEEIFELNDGSFIVGGSTSSNDTDVSFNHGGMDFWLIKINNEGVLLWEKTFGGSLDESLGSINLTYDGGYILTGFSFSTDGDLSNNYGAQDLWVVKLSSSGNIEWQKSYGGSFTDFGSKILQAPNGEYFVGGYTASNDNDIDFNNGGWDYWLIKLSNTGSLIWSKCYGGSDNDFLVDFTITFDNSISLCGRTDSEDGDVSENNGGADYWIVKLEPNILDIKENTYNYIVYPNPARDYFSIKINEEEFANVKLSVFNALGVLVYQNDNVSPHQQIDVSSWAKGHYFVKIQNEAGTFFKQIFH